MFYYKILNLVKENGRCDYKGLDIEKIMPGSPVYNDPHITMCVLASEEDIQGTEELIKLTEEEYTTEAETIKANIPPAPPTPQEEITQLKEQNVLMQQALDELILGGAL
jgi:polyhydroxyalkanoate synthesis regulator protein